MVDTKGNHTVATWVSAWTREQETDASGTVTLVGAHAIRARALIRMEGAPNLPPIPRAATGRRPATLRTWSSLDKVAITKLEEMGRGLQTMQER